MTYTANSMRVSQFGLHSPLSDSCSRLSIHSFNTFLCLDVLIVTKTFIMSVTMDSFIDPLVFSHHFLVDTRYGP